MGRLPPIILGYFIYLALGGCTVGLQVQVVDISGKGELEGPVSFEMKRPLLPLTMPITHTWLAADADGRLELSWAGMNDSASIQYNHSYAYTLVGPWRSPKVDLDGSAKGAAITKYIEVKSKELQQERDDHNWLVVPVFRPYGSTLWSAEEILAFPNAELVVDLRLAGQDIDDAAMAAVSRFPNLRFIWISATRCSDAGLKHLIPLRHLLSVDSWYNHSVTSEGIDHLRTNMPGVELLRVTQAP